VSIDRTSVQKTNARDEFARLLRDNVNDSPSIQFHASDDVRYVLSRLDYSESTRRPFVVLVAFNIRDKSGRLSHELLPRRLCCMLAFFRSIQNVVHCST
jgi:hypothetical protein